MAVAYEEGNSAGVLVVRFIGAGTYSTFHTHIIASFNIPPKETLSIFVVLGQGLQLASAAALCRDLAVIAIMFE